MACPTPAVSESKNPGTTSSDSTDSMAHPQTDQKTNSSKLNSVLVSPRQKGNPLLKNIRNVPWEYDDIIPDYVMGKTTCALFLSLRYHNLHPNYIHNRLKELGSMYELRVIVVLVDSKDPQHALKELAKICLLGNCTLILAWSNEEAGRYLETYKSYEHKPPDMIMEKAEKNYNAQIVDCLTSVKSVNKTDALTLLSSFGSLEKISEASLDDLSLCPGFGPQKKQKLYDIFRTPFRKCTSGITDMVSPMKSKEKVVGKDELDGLSSVPTEGEGGSLSDVRVAKRAKLNDEKKSDNDELIDEQ